MEMFATIIEFRDNKVVFPILKEFDWCVFAPIGD